MIPVPVRRDRTRCTRPGDLPLSGEQRPHPPRDRAPGPRRGDRRGAVVAVAAGVAALSFAGVYVLWRVFVDTLAGQQVENAAFQGALYGQTQLWRVAERVLDVVSVGFIAAVLIAAMLIAALRRRWSLALQVAVLMIGANLTTRVLKNWVLYRPDLGVEASYGNTLPSGHTTAAASVSAALLLVVPPRAPGRGRRCSVRGTRRPRGSRRSSASGTARRTSSRPSSWCSRGQRSRARWSRSPPLGRRRLPARCGSHPTDRRRLRPCAASSRHS